ncbi:MAG TPA: hypothetical protein VMT20_28110 [Terriglobia bacterium]|nr:hypothetical protein [Terriglobia bacterium]
MNGTSGSSVSIGKLIAVPALITLVITILRLVGELQHWPAPWVSSAAGGAGAIIGISWLPFIFGPYFAWKLAATGDGPASAGKAIGMCAVGLVVFVLGGVGFGVGLSKHITPLILLGFLLALASAFFPRLGWRSFGNALLAYAFAARIPVLIVMYIAMSANGGQGWGTHYDAADPSFVVTSFAQKFVDLAVLPQMSLWIGWTAVIGGLLGSIVVAIFHPGKHTAPAAA